VRCNSAVVDVCVFVFSRPLYCLGAVWRLLPWNKGRVPTASTYVKFVDEDFRVMADRDGEMFVYCKVEEL
jgi:hypothetical protein